MNKSLLIWDLDNKPQTNSDYIINWNSYFNTEKKKIISINDIIESNDIYLKKKILEFISSIKNIKIKNQTIEEILKIKKKEISFWWFSSIFEKNNETKLKELNDIIKILALKIFIKKKKIKFISIFSKNKSLIYSIKKICEKNNLILENNYFKEKKNKLYPKLYLSSLISILIIYLKNIFFFDMQKKIRNYKCNLFFSYYSTNKKKSSFNQEIFWGNLIEKNKKKKIIFLIPDEKISILERFKLSLKIRNQQADNNIYISIFNFLDLRLIIKTLVIYTKHYLKFKKNFILKKINFKNDSECIIFLKQKILYNCLGKDFIINLLYFNLYQKIFCIIKKPEKVIFLQENQNWEKIMIYQFKKKFNTNLIGYAHTSIRFWDLRYLNSTSDLKNNNKIIKKISPDLTIVNNNFYKNYLKKYSQNKILKCESLRYLNILKNNLELNKKSKYILIIFDGILNQDFYLINFINNLSTTIKKKYIFVLKLHNLTNLIILKKIRFRYIIEKNKIFNFKKKFKLICVGPGTSAAMDLSFINKKFLTILCPNILNLSPVKNKKFSFVKNNNQFDFFLKNEKQIKFKKINFFTLNKSLKLWKKII